MTSSLPNCAITLRLDMERANGDKLLRSARLAGKVYLPVQEYPDAEIVAPVAAAASMTYLLPDWKTIDIIDKTEGTVHTVERVKNPGTKLPELPTIRHGPDEVVLIYTSPRKMCALAIGLRQRLGKALWAEGGCHPDCLHAQR
jgi:hypothetical protein